MALCGLLLTAAVIAVLIEMRTAERQKRKTCLLHVVFPCLLVLLLYIRVSEPLFVLRGMALIFCLYTASLQDLYNREVDDCLWVMVLLSALIRFEPAEILIMLAGMFIAAFPLFAASILKNGSIGGADVKLMAAVGFFFTLTSTELYAVTVTPSLMMSCTSFSTSSVAGTPVLS